MQYVDAIPDTMKWRSRLTWITVTVAPRATIHSELVLTRQRVSPGWGAFANCQLPKTCS